MKPRHVIVNGDELAAELARLKASGSLVESVDVLAGKRNSAYRINFVDRVTAPMAAAASKDGMRNLEPGVVSSKGPNLVPVKSIPELSISDRMARLKAMAIGAGRVRQFKPSTNPNSARVPHKND